MLNRCLRLNTPLRSLHKCPTFWATMSNPCRRLPAWLKESKLARQVFVVSMVRENQDVVTIYSEESGVEHEIEADALRPLVKSEHMKAFDLLPTRLRLVFPYALDGTLLATSYPWRDAKPVSSSLEELLAQNAGAVKPTRKRVGLEASDFTNTPGHRILHLYQSQKLSIPIFASIPKCAGTPPATISSLEERREAWPSFPMME